MVFTVFEGSEKKCEVIMQGDSVDLRSLGDEFGLSWYRHVLQPFFQRYTMMFAMPICFPNHHFLFGQIFTDHLWSNKVC